MSENVPKKKSIIDKVLTRIESAPDGTIFSINDFFDIGVENTVKSALLRLNRRGKIMRIFDGLYSKYRYNRVIDRYTLPGAFEFAKKIASKFSWNVCPAELTALKFVGFDINIKNTLVFVTDGAYRKYSYNGWNIIFKSTDPKYILHHSIDFLMLIQAIKYIGTKRITLQDLNIFVKFSRKITEDLIEDSVDFPGNIRKILALINYRMEDDII